MGKGTVLTGFDQESAVNKSLETALENAGLSRNQVEKSNEYLLKVLEIPGVKDSANEQLNQAIFQLGFNYSRLKNPAKSNEYLLKLLELPGLEISDKEKFVKASYQIGANYFTLKN